MVAEADLVCQPSVSVLDVPYLPKESNIHEIEDVAAVTPPSFDRVRASELVPAELLSSQEVSEFLWNYEFFLLSDYYYFFFVLCVLDCTDCN